MTQLEYALKNKITRQMRKVAKAEGLAPEDLRAKVALGEVVIPVNRNRPKPKPCGIGAGLTTKVNANIGSSEDYINMREELKKLKVAVKYGSDTIMDLSTGGNLTRIRKRIIEESPIPVGTVPIYEAVVNCVRKKKSIANLTGEDIFSAILNQAKEGVDFMTLHCGVTRQTVERLKKQKRLIDMVSRGGTFLAEWIILKKKENPLYENFGEVLEIARKYDITLSLGDGMRPGAIADATDGPQIEELVILSELAKKARRAGVQVMIEGPGHIPINQIKANVLLEKRLSGNTPFYVLGPLVTDIAPGYDHITGAIGGALAASYGADYLCYVTPSEHLRLPDINDVKEGVITTKLAAHAADVAKGLKRSVERDNRMSKARRERNWKRQISLALNPEKAVRLRRSSKPLIKDVCTMCGEYCAIKMSEELRK